MDNYSLFFHVARSILLNQFSWYIRGWGPHDNLYSLQDRCFLLLKGVSYRPIFVLWKHIWKGDGFPRIKIYHWIIIHYKLISYKNLNKTKIEGSFRCSLFFLAKGSISHHFLEFVKSISRFGISPLLNWDKLCNIHKAWNKHT